MGNGDSPQDTLVEGSTTVSVRPSSPDILMKDPPLAPSVVVVGLSLDFFVLISSMDSIVVSISLSPLAPSMMAAGSSLDFAILITGMDSAAISIFPSTPGILMMDPPLAPSMVVDHPSLDSAISFSGVSKVVPPMVPFLGSSVSSQASTITSSFVTFSLASGISGTGCDGAYF